MSKLVLFTPSTYFPQRDEEAHRWMESFEGDVLVCVWGREII